MLKEIVICVAIVIVIFLGNIITQNYTKDMVEELSGMLNDLKDEIVQKQLVDENVEQISQETKTSIESKASRISDTWEERYDKLAYYIEHNELEKIETGLTQMKSNIETMEYAYSICEIDKSMFLLENVQDRYAFNLKNIF